MALHGTLLPPRANAGRHVGAVVGDGVGCKHAHQSAHGVAAIECALRAAHDVDTFDTLKREIVARLVDVGHVVNIQPYCGGVDAAANATNVAGRGEAAAVLWHVEVGRIGREVFQRTGLAVVERACVEQTDAEWLLAQLAGFFG